MNALEYFSEKRVNIDLLLYTGPNGVLHIGIRVRPWSQQTKRPLMLLSQGLTLIDAINKAARDYHLDRWQELDWRRRPWDSVTESYQSGPEQDTLDFMAEDTGGDTLPPRGTEKPDLTLIHANGHEPPVSSSSSPQDRKAGK